MIYTELRVAGMGVREGLQVHWEVSEGSHLTFRIQDRVVGCSEKCFIYIVRELNALIRDNNCSFNQHFLNH